MSPPSRFRLPLALAVLTGLLVAREQEGPRASERGFTQVVWHADFDRSRHQCDISDAGWDSYGGAGNPPCPASVRVVDTAREGLPPLGRRHRAMRLGLRPVDSRRGVIFAKIGKPFFAPGYADGQQPIHATRPPADVSGSYRAWFYLPRDFRIRGTGWRNVMQFKERYWDGSENGYRSEPMWWLVLYNPRGDHRGHVTAGIRYWGDGKVGSVGRARPFPRGRWVEVRADLRQGRSITWTLDGRRLGVGTPSRYPVGPRRGALSLAWDFIVGNYAGAGVERTWRNRISRPLYVGDAVVLR